MPYAKKLQSERDPVAQEQMRERWRKKKRRQRARRRAAAKKHIDEGRPAYRAPDHFMRSPRCPNRAMWDLRRHLRDVSRLKIPLNRDLVLKAARLKTTRFWLRANPIHNAAYRIIFQSVLTSRPVGGTLITDLRPSQESDSYEDRTSSVDGGARLSYAGAPLAPKTQEVVPMTPTEDNAKRTKFDPEKQFTSLAKAIQEEIARTARNYPAGRGELPIPSQTQKPHKERPRRRAWPNLNSWWIKTGLTPPEEEKRKRIAEMRKALAESEAKESRPADKGQDSPDDGLLR